MDTESVDQRIGLKKGTRIKILDNPKKPDSRVIGTGRLLHCFSKKAYEDVAGETWSVELEETGEKKTFIVSPRDVLPEK